MGKCHGSVPTLLQPPQFHIHPPAWCLPHLPPSFPSAPLCMLTNTRHTFTNVVSPGPRFCCTWSQECHFGIQSKEQWQRMLWATSLSSKANILPNKAIYAFSLKLPKAEMQLPRFPETSHLWVSATPDSMLGNTDRELDRCNLEDAAGKEMNSY